MDKESFCFLRSKELFNKLNTIIDTKDMILFKASRGMHLEKTVEKIGRGEVVVYNVAIYAVLISLS